MNLRGANFILVLIVVMLLPVSSGMAAENIPLIDMHNQVDENCEMTGEEILSIIRAAGVSRSFLAARYAQHDYYPLKVAAQFPSQILPLIRLKGDMSFEENNNQLQAHLNARLKQKSYFGVAELLLYHAVKQGPNTKVAGLRSFTFNNEKVAMVTDVAERNKWPILLHIEFRASGSRRQSYMENLEKHLKNHPNLPMVMMHMGQLDPEEVERLILRHINIHFAISRAMTEGKISANAQPWTVMFSKEMKLLDAWRELFIKYPDRFLFCIDNVWISDWNNYLRKVKKWRDALSELPPEVAHKIGHQNAERLWHLDPIQ